MKIKKLNINNIGKIFLLGALVFFFTGKALSAAEDCESYFDLSYVCGPLNAEDILQLGDTEWLVTSGMDGEMTGSDVTGHIYLVNHEDKTFEVFFPGDEPAFEPDDELFGDCPGPINVLKFSAHGLALKERSPGRYRLYITSHGEREAIEVFDIVAGGAKPSIAWAGCVRLPNYIWANSVAILKDWGFVVTQFMDPTEPNGFGDIFAGKRTGGVFEWHPDGELMEVAGTRLSGPNGITLSPDERSMFVNAFGTRQVVRFDRTTDPVRKRAVEVPVAPDNIRWGDDGLLYTAGVNYIRPGDCISPPCSTGWSVIQVHPRTLVSKRVAGANEKAVMQGASSVIPVGDEYWIGTYSGDRIGYLPRK